MSLTFTPDNVNQPIPFGELQAYLGTLVFDSSYNTGGETITQAGSGIKNGNIIGVMEWGANSGAALRKFAWDYANQKYKCIAASGGRVVTYAPGGGDIKGATNPAGTEGNADQAAAPVNSTLLMAAATVTSLALTATPTVQPSIPRNIMITIFNDSGGSLNLYEGVTTFTITGTYLGAAQTETVTLTSTAGNKAIANTPKYRYVQGVKPFSTVTTVTWDNAPAATLKLSLGIGTRIGLPVPLETATYTDVIGLTVNAAKVAATATVTSAGGVDTTNNTVNVGTIADGDDVGVIFKALGQEETSTTDLSGSTLRVMVLTANRLV